MEMNFTKPSGTDNFSIGTQNDNWDKAQTGFYKVAPGILAESEQGAMVTVNDSSDNPMYATLHGETKQHCEIDVTPTQSDSNVFISLIPWNKGDSIVLTLNTPRNVEYMVKREDGVIIGAAGVDSTTKQVWNYTNSDGTLGIQFYVKDATVDDVVSVQKLPSPTNEVPIYGAGESGVLFTESTGKNLVYETYEKVAITGDGILSLNASFSMHVAKVESGKTYTITTDEVNGFVGGYYVDKPTVASRTHDNTRITQASKTITIPSGVSYVSFRSNYGYATPQIEEGTKATPYEPYTETTADIPLSAPLYKGDYIRLNMDGSGELIRKMKSVVLDGSENRWNYWTNNSTANYFFSTLNNLGLANAMLDNSRVCVYSSHFKGVKSTDMTKGFEVIATGTNNDGGNYLFFNTQIATTQGEWEAWLAKNPVTVVYELAEPTVTPLTAERIAELKKLRSFYPVTHATIDDGEISIEYIADTKRYIDNKFEELQNAILTSV